MKIKIKKRIKTIKNGAQNEVINNNDSIKKYVNKSVNNSIESSNKNSYEHSSIWVLQIVSQVKSVASLLGRFFK